MLVLYKSSCYKYINEYEKFPRLASLFNCKYMSMSNFKSTIYVIPSNVRTKNLVVIKTKIQFQRSEYYLNFSPVISLLA